MSGSEQRVAVVTGAAKGIGLASCERLAAAGFAIVMVDREEDELKQAAAVLEAAGHTVMVSAGDVSSFAGVQAQWAAILARFGRVDALVNNAGIAQPKTLLEITEEEFDRTISINLKGYFNWCKAVAQTMVDRQYGRIVNISSVSANTGAAPSAVSKFAYCAAKAGVLGLTRGLAKELAPHVTVNAICPGSIMTALTEKLITSNRTAIENTIPLGRIGTPMDIAVVVEFLIVVQPNFITGEIVDVDGGQWVN